MTGAIGKFSDIHDEKLQIEALKIREEQDSLSKLYNRMSARKRIEERLFTEHIAKSALISLDLDLFKHVDDQHGHMFGDALLKNIAKQIVNNIRKGDIAARIGGDEFLIFIFNQEEALIVERLFQAINLEYVGMQIALSRGWQPQQVSNRRTNERKAKCGTLVDTCSKIAADFPCLDFL